MSLKLNIGGVVMNVVSAYAPQVGRKEEEKEKFWSKLEELIGQIPPTERVVIGADFNAHVGEGNSEDEEVLGPHGYKKRNAAGQRLIDFAKRMEMVVVNTFFPKREEDRVTFESGEKRSQVDYIMCRRVNLKEVIDCEVVPVPQLQHRLVICRMRLQIEPRIQWRKLREVDCVLRFKEELKEALGGQEELPEHWETTAKLLRGTAKKVLGVSSWTREEHNEDGFTEEGATERCPREQINVGSKSQRTDKGKHMPMEIREHEVKEALRMVKKGKAVGPDNIPVEVWECLGAQAVKFLTRLFNTILKSERMPDEWRKSSLVQIRKNKQGPTICVTLKSHTMKMWEQVIGARLRREVSISEQQYGFTMGHMVTDLLAALTKLRDDYRKGQKELHCLCVQLESAYDKVPREDLWNCMRDSRAPEKYVRIVQDMYEGSETVVRGAAGVAECSKVGLLQGSTLSPFLFAIVLGQFTHPVREVSPWTMMSDKNIVICSESKDELETKLERWRHELETRGMCFSRTKTQHACLNEREAGGSVMMQGREVVKTKMLKCFGTVIEWTDLNGGEEGGDDHHGWAAAEKRGSHSSEGPD
ncbi:uncharacterized protein ACB058_000226 isoform 2-T4 [Synchiropus picturatus]